MSRRVSAGRAVVRQRVVRTRGYVLLMVLAALTVIAVVAGSFAVRIDALRGQARNMLDHAEARRLANNARAEVLYWLTTRPIGLASAGFADEPALVLDGRPYTTAEGAVVRVQDERGLLSLNAPDREAWTALLVQSGTAGVEAQALLDVLEDYVDSDSLRRLQGAEALDYSAAGLPPPRNDWVLSVDELQRMPVWNKLPQLHDRIRPWLSTRRDRLFNPNTAPMGLLRALYPKAAAEQWDIFESVRNRAPFLDSAAVAAATGLQFSGEGFLFHGSNALRLQVWAPGLPQTLEYNLLILPTGVYAPWRVHEVRLGARPADLAASADVQRLVANFPTPSPAAGIVSSAAQPAP